MVIFDENRLEWFYQIFSQKIEIAPGISRVFLGLVVKCAYGKYDLSEYVSLDTKIGINETRFYWFMINCYPLWLIYHLSLIICKIMTSTNLVGNRDQRTGQNQYWENFQSWSGLGLAKFPNLRLYTEKW